MRKARINYEYLNPIREPIELLIIKLKTLKRRLKKSQKILIINPCLIGEYIVSLPAIAYFIKKNRKYKIDLLVSPALKSLSENIRGINKIFVTKSMYSRAIENARILNQDFGEYKEILILRAGKDVFNALKSIKSGKIKTSIIPFTKYGINLIANLLLRKTPKQWMEVSFEMIGEKVHKIKFKEIFKFSKEEYSKVRNLNVMKTKSKIIIIHTGASWIMNRWDNNKWRDLIDKINLFGNYRFVFIGSSENEKKDFMEISEKLPFKIHSLIGKINLKELMILLRLSDYFIGIDSGPANMAHLADLRSLTILGPGPHMFMPWSKKDKVVDKSNGRGLYQRFFYKKKGFLDKITTEEAFEKFKKLLKNKSRT